MATMQLAAEDVMIELTGVNRKSLEVFANLPREWQSLEAAFTSSIRKHIQRGRIAISVGRKQYNTNCALFWNAPGITEAIQQLKDLSASHHIPFTCSSELLFRIATTLSSLKTTPMLDEATQSLIQDCFEAALQDFQKSCNLEGSLLKQDFAERLESLSQLLAEITLQSHGVALKYHAALMNRLRQMELEIDLNDERVLKEIALFADRCDITEELTRFKAHLSQFNGLLEEQGPVGRKLDFLCQELLRELNTIGSKANALAITRLVIEGKNEVERIREQAQNIE